MVLEEWGRLEEGLVLRKVALQRGEKYGYRVVFREEGLVDESCKGGNEVEDVGRGRMFLEVE